MGSNDVVMVDDGRMFRKSRPHFPPFSLRLVLLSAAILVKIVTMSVIFSLLWPFRRSASAAEKFVAELSSMKIWSYDVNNKLWTYEVNKRL